MYYSLRAGQLVNLGMPTWLHGSKLEHPVRTFGRKTKSVIHVVEKFLRRKKVRLHLNEIEREIWMDYDFVVSNPLPQVDPLLTTLISFLKPGQTVYDVGGFVGWYAVYSAHKVGANGKVVTFEPVPETANLLRRHLTLNNITGRVRLVEAACSNNSGVISMPAWSKITYASGNAIRNAYPDKNRKPRFMSVCTICLDDFWKSDGTQPDIIKIDVEGAELWVLQGATSLLKQVRPMVFLEIHSFAWSIFDTTESQFINFLKSVDYELCEVYPPYDLLQKIPDYGCAILFPRN